MRAERGRPLAMAAIASLATFVAAGCGGGEVTWLDVKVVYAGDVVLDQIRFELLDGAAPVASALRPDPGGAPLPSGQGLVFLLPGAVAGHRLTVNVRGLLGGAERFTGTSGATPIAGRGVDVPVALGAKADEPPTAIAVTPARWSGAAGSTLQLAASASFSDGSNRDVTARATWRSLGPTVAMVDAGGLVVALKPGVATVTASVSGMGGAAEITVTDATLTSIELTPPNDAIQIFGTRQFAAIGHYTDGSRAPVTPQATWASSKPTVASMQDSAGNKGLATGLLSGTTEITAAFSGLVGRTMLTVK